jgi:hypothetical protein
MAANVRTTSLVTDGRLTGRVRVEFNGNRGWRQVDLFGNGDELVVSGGPPPTKFAAYGPTRLAATEQHEQSTRYEAHAHVRNLFDAWQPMSEPTSWMLGIGDERFNEIGATLKALLPLPENAYFARRHGHVELHDGIRTFRFDQLSAGYQGMVVLAADLMRFMLERWEDLSTAEGIVLVDEIGTHLHPRWQMVVVGGLRRAFPRVQFIITTHDPLCLRGVREGEVAVLRKLSGATVVDTELPDVRALSVDQILGSEHFGLGSTIDPEAEQEFHAYYGLLAIPEADRSAKERRRLDELRSTLNLRGVLGRTRREQLALAAADEFLAQAAQLAPDEAAELEPEVRERIQGIWAEV